MPRRDPELRREYHRVYMARRYRNDSDFRARHRARVKKNNDRYRTVARRLVAEFKSSGCALCDEKEPVCMSAHHLDPKKKEISIGDVVRLVWSENRIKSELEKCVCLCENCHRKVHAGIMVL